MNYHFHPEAEEEFLGAIDWYEEHEENLGLDFAREVYDSQEPDGIFVLAVMHLHRDPNYWKHRLG